MGKKDKRELENRLMTLFEHALKRCYVPLPECYRGWENTLKRTQKELKKILRDSPSLKNYFDKVFVDCYRDGVDRGNFLLLELNHRWRQYEQFFG